MDPTAVVMRYGSMLHTLLPGHDGAVGRGAPDQPVEIRLSAALDVSRRVAIVSNVADGRWAVHTISTNNGVTVCHAGGSVIRVPALQRLVMPDWFDDAYLVVTTPSAEYEVRVQVGPGPNPPRSGAIRSLVDSSTDIVLPRNPHRADFRTALCLCEPMLDDPFNRRVPPEGEIASRLNQLGLEDPVISARTVERRLARLRERLGVASNAELRDRLVMACLVTRDGLDPIRQRKDDA